MIARFVARRSLALAASLVCFTITPALAAVIHVNVAAAAGGNGTTWALAYNDLNVALAAAAPGDSCWIAEGTYRPATNAGFVVNRPLSFYGGFKGTELTLQGRLGSFANTILDGNIGNLAIYTDNALHVLDIQNVVGTGGSPGVVIDGLAISNGYATGANVSGAGIQAIGSDVGLANCFLTSNYAAVALTNLGGGIYAAKGMSAAAGLLQIKNCEFNDNKAYLGGAIYAEFAHGEVVDSSFKASVSTGDGGAVFLTGFNSGDRLDFTSCVFWNNFTSIASTGGAIALEVGASSSGASSRIVNCTLADNRGNASADGQALYVGTSCQAEVYNSILYFNNFALGAPIGGAGAVTVDYTDIEGGGYPGLNITLDPVFSNHGLGNLRLKITSLCVDAANYGLLPTDSLDVDGDGDTTEALPEDAVGSKRLFDQTAVGDSGVGSSACSFCTYLDMGAIEAH
ncbi:MAG: hypothetical protein IPJ19_14995 [Planctomycetes bacterium]|nr:hypothetical protein [Planctomycetota bacterium]